MFDRLQELTQKEIITSFLTGKITKAPLAEDAIMYLLFAIIDFTKVYNPAMDADAFHRILTTKSKVSSRRMHYAVLNLESYGILNSFREDGLEISRIQVTPEFFELYNRIAAETTSREYCLIQDDYIRVIVDFISRREKLDSPLKELITSLHVQREAADMTASKDHLKTHNTAYRELTDKVFGKERLIVTGAETPAEHAPVKEVKPALVDYEAIIEEMKLGPNGCHSKDVLYLAMMLASDVNMVMPRQSVSQYSRCINGINNLYYVCFGNGRIYELDLANDIPAAQQSLYQKEVAYAINGDIHLTDAFYSYFTDLEKAYGDLILAPFAKLISDSVRAKSRFGAMSRETMPMMALEIIANPAGGTAKVPKNCFFIGAVIGGTVVRNGDLRRVYDYLKAEMGDTKNHHPRTYHVPGLDGVIVNEDEAKYFVESFRTAKYLLKK